MLREYKGSPCFLCKKTGLHFWHSEQRTYTPILTVMRLCKLHWGVWRASIFRLPLKYRKLFIKKMTRRFGTLNTKEFKAVFGMLWEALMEASESRKTSPLEAFFRQLPPRDRVSAIMAI